MQEKTYRIGDIVFERYLITGTGRFDGIATLYPCAGFDGGAYAFDTGPCAEEYEKRFLEKLEAWERLDHIGIPKPMRYEFRDGALEVLIDQPLCAMQPVSALSALFQPSQDGDADGVPARILLQSADILAALARAGFVHGNVKPDNLLWDGKQLWLADYLLLPGGYTPAYCSMEQMDGQPLTHKTDVYSWAVSMMELYLGERPWSNGVVAGLMAVEYFTLISYWPEGMKPLLAECMNSEPEKRPDWPEILTRLRRIFAEDAPDSSSATETLYDPGATVYEGTTTVMEDLSGLDMGTSTVMEPMTDEEKARQANQAIDEILAKTASTPPDRRTRDDKYRFGKILCADDPFYYYEAEEVNTGKTVRLMAPYPHKPDDPREEAWIKAALKTEFIASCCAFSGCDMPREQSPVLCWQSPEDIWGREITYLVSDQPWGMDFYEWEKRHPSMEEAEAVRLTIELLRALGGLHSGSWTYMGNADFLKMRDEPMVHRLVHPGNIRIVKSEDGGPPRLLLTGFNSAVQAGQVDKFSDDLVDPSLVCNPRFACKEQLSCSAPPSEAWDVWGAAACLYYFLTGKPVRRPEQGPNHIAALLRAPVVPIEQNGRKLSTPHLAEVIDGALDDTNGLTYKSAPALIAALADCLLAGAASSNNHRHESQPLKEGQHMASDDNTVYDPGATKPDSSKTVYDPGATVYDPGTTVCDPDKTVCDPGATVFDGGATVYDPGATVFDGGATVYEPGATGPENDATASDPPERYRVLCAEAQAAWHSGRIGDALRLAGDAIALEKEANASTASELRSELGRFCKRTKVRSVQECMRLDGHKGWDICEASAIDPTGQVLATGGDCEDSSIRLWDLKTGAPLNTLDTDQAGVKTLSFSPDGRLLLSGMDDNTAVLWDVQAGERVHVLTGHKKHPQSGDVYAAFSPRGTEAASGGRSSDVIVWDVKTGAIKRSIQLDGYGINAICYSADGEAVIVSNDNMLHVYSAETGALLKTLEKHEYNIFAMCASADGTRIYSADDSLCVWDAKSGKLICAFEADDLGLMTSMALSGDGSILAITPSSDDTVHLWHMPDKRVIATVKVPEKYTSGVSISPDGTRLAACCEFTVRVWAIDYEYEFPGWMDWDEAAQPYLRVFLRLHPDWTEDDLAAFIRDLQNRGLGYIRPEGVRAMLREHGHEALFDPGASMSDATLSDAAERTDAPASNLSIQRGDTILDTYEVESDAIEGGMGSVWRVHHSGWNTDLAMKRPQPKCFATEKSKADFIHECEAWIKLGLHPNIVSCYYVREISGTPSIFSEWMDGGSLESAINNGTLYAGTEAEQQERVLDIAIQFARGLHYAHEAKPNGLIHQDVKPDNLLLTKEGEAKVADFGLAKARAVLTQLDGSPTVADESADGGKTILSPSGGYTPAYCSMEQMDGKVLSRRTDIYSWAVSVMEMYVGSRPWANGVVAGLSCRSYFEDTKLPMPEALQELLAKCMETEPDDRPHDFQIIEDELQKIYEAETGSPYPRPMPKAAADTADSLNNRALSMLDLGKPEEAERLWERAAAAEPNHVETRYNSMLAKCRRENNNDYNALIDIQSAIYSLCLGQPSAKSYYLMGMQSLAGYNRAEMDFQQAAALAEDAAMRARCEEMQRKAARACHQLPVQLSDGSGDDLGWEIPFDVSEDGLRCAVSYAYVYCIDESERRLLLFDLTTDKLIAQQTIDNMLDPYLRFEGDRLYVGSMWSEITAWNAYTLEPLEYEEGSFELPEERRYVLYDGVREITKPQQITAMRGRETIKSTTGGNELMNNVTGDILIDPHVNRVMGMDSRGWYLHIKFDYGPHPSNDTLDLYDTRVFGQPMEYALCRVSTVQEVLSRADALAAAMDDANAAYAAQDHGKALSALDEAYKLMNGDPSEEWETLNNAVGLHGVRKRLRGWRKGQLRGAITRIRDSAYGFEKNANRARFDEGRIWFTEAGKESSVPCPKECRILKADCVSYDRARHVLCWASDSGELRAWDMAGDRALGTTRFSEPVPPKSEWRDLDSFSFFRPSAGYVLRPLRLMLNADASAALLECEVCNPYDEADDYSNAHKLLLFNLSDGRLIHGECVANEWMDRDQAESNEAPYEAACFSPDGRSLLIKKEMRTNLWCFCDLVSCDTHEPMNLSVGSFRADGNSFPDGNNNEEIILDWEYALEQEGQP